LARGILRGPGDGPRQMEGSLKVKNEMKTGSRGRGVDRSSKMVGDKRRRVLGMGELFLGRQRPAERKLWEKKRKIHAELQGRRETATVILKNCPVKSEVKAKKGG